MAIPNSNQTVHLMNWYDVFRVRGQIDGCSKAELELYTTDSLRLLYQSGNDDLIRLRDGIVSRNEIVAEIRWRIFVGRTSYEVLFSMTVIAAIAAVVAAVEGWK